jgi:hypothetical protein
MAALGSFGRLDWAMLQEVHYGFKKTQEID